MPSRAPSPTRPKPGSAALLTGQFVVVTATSSASPTELVPLNLLAPGKTFVYIAAVLAEGQASAVSLVIGFGGTGVGFAIPKTIFPGRGLQLVLDWEPVGAEIGAPITAWAGTGSVVCCKVAIVER